MLDDTDRHADFTRTRAGYFFLVDDFRTSLPEPPKETPEKRQQRLQAAISAVASLCPATGCFWRSRSVAERCLPSSLFRPVENLWMASCHREPPGPCYREPPYRASRNPNGV